MSYKNEDEILVRLRRIETKQCVMAAAMGVDLTEKVTQSNMTLVRVKPNARLPFWELAIDLPHVVSATHIQKFLRDNTGEGKQLVSGDVVRVVRPHHGLLFELIVP